MPSTSDIIGETGLTPFVEEAGLLFGKKAGKTWTCHLQHLSQGSAVSVEFDWKIVFEHETRNSNVLGFFHTHPLGLIKPSRRDIRTMRAWCDCLGKPLLCAIGGLGSTGDEVVCYVFRNYRSRGRRLTVYRFDPDGFEIGVYRRAH